VLTTGHPTFNCREAKRWCIWQRKTTRKIYSLYNYVGLYGKQTMESVESVVVMLIKTLWKGKDRRCIEFPYFLSSILLVSDVLAGA
jgi:hypothetical protein